MFHLHNVNACSLCCMSQLSLYPNIFFSLFFAFSVYNSYVTRRILAMFDVSLVSPTLDHSNAYTLLTCTWAKFEKCLLFFCEQIIYFLPQWRRCILAVFFYLLRVSWFPGVCWRIKELQCAHDPQLNYLKSRLFSKRKFIYHCACETVSKVYLD